MLVYSLLLSVLAYLSAGNADLNLLDARESVGVLVQVAITVGVRWPRSLPAPTRSPASVSAAHSSTSCSRRRPLSSLVIGKLDRCAVGVVRGHGDRDPLRRLARRRPWRECRRSPRPDRGWKPDRRCAGRPRPRCQRRRIKQPREHRREHRHLARPGGAEPATPERESRNAWRRSHPRQPGQRRTELASNVLVDQRSWGSQWSLLVAPAIAAAVFISLAIVLARRVKLGGLR